MIREDLQSLPAYVPGKRDETALKLSSNEVTTTPLPAAIAAMAQAASSANRYPDMAAIEIRTALAAHLGLGVEQVAVGTGSSALCQQLIQISSTPDNEVIFPWRSFEAYPIFVQVVGVTPVPIALTTEGRHDLDAMAAAITERTSVIFLCNPNNPTGATLTTAEFEEFMTQVPARVIVALDEAYFEYNRAADTPVSTEAITRYPNVVGLRTFSKAYGLAGARIGYAFGPKELIDALNKVAIPFGVSSVAQTGALASLAASDELLGRTEVIVAERDRVADAVGAAHSEANFVWVPTPAGDPEFPSRTAAALAQQGVLVRAFPEGIRITVSIPEENDQLIAAWRAVLG